MSGILLNVIFATLTGSMILAVRKMWGERLYPQVLKGFWVLFFICALLPMSSADRLGRTVVQRDEQEASVKYTHPVHNEADKAYPEYSMETMKKYRFRGWLRELALTVWGAGCIISLLYKAVGAGILYYKSRADYRYELPPEKLQEKGISLSVPVRVTENTGPMVLGIRPVIYVPERFLLGDESLFRSIVLHEKEHIAGKHHLVLVLMNLTGSIYWFLPYMEKVFFRALREDMEYRCDYELVRSHAVEAKEYAKHCVVMAEDRGRLCNELPFGEGRLKKRVGYILQNGKEPRKSLLAGAVIGITVLVCLIGTALYYKRDVQGFTRWEVEGAKEDLVAFWNTVNKGNEDDVSARTVENSPWGAPGRFSEGEFVIYDISYEPKHWSYYYAKKYMDAHGLDKSNCIYFQASIIMKENLYDNFGFWLVREDKNSMWKLYDGGY